MCKKKNKREELLSLIPDGAKKILDVGCGKAELSSKLKIQGVEVVGVEKDERLYAFAKENLKQVLLGDIEKMQLPFPRGYFDCILYADILEHLSDPLAVLKLHREYLNDNGCVIASIPNIRYYKVIKGLVLDGAWDYVDTGILDRSHLRFFTVVNIQELFAAAGYEIIHIGRNVVASRLLKIINFISLNSLRNFLTYQYYIVAKKVSDASASSFKKRKIEQF